MTSWIERLAAYRPAPLVVDLGLVAVTLGDVALNHESQGPVTVVLAALACVVLLVRRRLPLTTLLATLPLAALQEVPLAPLVALVSLAALADRRWQPVAGLVLYTAAGALPWSFAPTDRFGRGDVVLAVVYTAATGAAAVLLGRLLRTRALLRRQVVELEEAQEHERELHAQTVLARERAQLSREMHDVVSHQVSLIAVQAGALQLSSTDPQVRDAARALRGLAVTTLDELRTMVTLLRASGTTSEELVPQPTLRDLETLVTGSGTGARLVGTLPEDLDSPTQRALYRTVQEALTNVRKHAPGSEVVVELRHDADGVEVLVTSTAGVRTPLGLPGSGHGLVGLRERAESLHGDLDAGPTPGDGWLVRLRVPRRTP